MVPILNYSIVDQRFPNLSDQNPQNHHTNNPGSMTLTVKNKLDNIKMFKIWFSNMHIVYFDLNPVLS